MTHMVLHHNGCSTATLKELVHMLQRRSRRGKRKGKKRRRRNAYWRAHKDVEFPHNDRELVTGGPTTEAILVQVAKGPTQPAHMHRQTQDRQTHDRHTLDRQVSQAGH